MSEQRSYYAVLGTHPYASQTEIHDAFRLAKSRRDLSTIEGYTEFRQKSDAYEVLRSEANRAGYDAVYLPLRAEAILEVVRLLVEVGLGAVYPVDKDGELTNKLEITFKRIAVEFGVTRQEVEWISTELSRLHPLEHHADAQVVMATMTPDDILSAIYAVRKNRLSEQERDLAKSTSQSFRAEAKNPGGTKASATVLKHPMLYTEIVDAKNRELAALITDMLEHPKDVDVLAKYFAEVDAGHFKAEWIIALAKANHTQNRINNYRHEYRAVLGNIAAALYQNPALAFTKVFTDNISKYVFDGLAHSTRTTEETQAFNLFSVVLTLNPDAFSYDEFERYCFRDNSPQGDGGMLVKQAIEVVTVRTDLGQAAIKGLVHKLYHHPSGADPKGVKYTELLDVMLEKGMISHELLNGLDAANKRRDKSSQQDLHDKLAAIIKDARLRVAERPTQLRYAGQANPNDICFID
ncbi:MAG: hypothetical protein SFW65_03420 [Alphaproteobacteria bacterium]|nr:hypothetical protein [Alphaproteobacteria bacterium]